MDRRKFCQTSAAVMTTMATHHAAVLAEETLAISALQPRSKSGHRSVLYSDCCSGIPGAALAKNLQAVNKMVTRIQPQPTSSPFPVMPSAATQRITMSCGGSGTTGSARR